MALPALNKTTALPAHLQKIAGNQALTALNQSASHGISAGGWPRIGIKGSRFRLTSADGEEYVVPQLHLDVIVVGANPHSALSKVYFAKKYDPNAEETAPDCFSDNGVAPSSMAKKPQCSTCAACPMNVIGSRVTDAGSSGKACGDYKKIAVLLADGTSKPVFELRLPYMSLKNWKTYIETLDKNGIPAATVVTRMTFDTSSDYPKLAFAPAFTGEIDSNGNPAMPYIDENQAADIEAVLGSDEVEQCTGAKDRPMAAEDYARLSNKTGNGAEKTPAPRPAAPPPHVAAPVPVAAPVAAPVAPPIADAPARRTRAKKVEPAAEGTLLDEPPAFVRNMPARNAAESVAPLTAKTTSNTLDDEIRRAMNV